IFAGGTASGKTTSLNAVSLFIPSNSKIVSIEDTREVELPQRNWVASVTRPSFSDDDRGDVDEFDLLEAALRQRPDYIVMGEIRGEEGRTLFQVMSTGHTTYTTFHADSVGEVLKRFTTDPINVSKTMFTALDLVSIQTSTRVQGNKVRRNKSLTEINHYDAENDEINVQDVYQWQAEGDEFLKMGSSNTLEDVRFDRGWTREQLDEELFMRRVVLAYLIDRGLNTYTQVAATLQAFINDQETILALMARDELERSLEDLREMESVEIDVDPEKEEMVPRPSPGEEIQTLCTEILERAEEELWPEYRDLDDVDVADALLDVESAPDVTAATGEHPELDALEERSDAPALDDGDDTPTLDDGADTPEIDGESETPALDPGPDESVDSESQETADGNADASISDGDFGIEDLLEEPSADETDDTAEANGGIDSDPVAADEDGFEPSDPGAGDAASAERDDAEALGADETQTVGTDRIEEPGTDVVEESDGEESDGEESDGEESDAGGSAIDDAEETDVDDAEEVDADESNVAEPDVEGADDDDADDAAEEADEAWDFGDVRQVDGDEDSGEDVGERAADDSTESDG
ncbi:ATPase, T2SS/T4P/T4SS family, partial [Halobellus rufus]|uniref:ATPase, T2SS/T4P/T4SS family n=1 Tax=Halobellus rufus TaxID=1448860 RepID=UPI001E38C5C6